MKISHMTLTIMVLLSTASLAYAGDMGDMNMKSMNDMPMTERIDGKMNMQVHHATGVVTKMDKSAGRVTISHGPIKTIPWPAMTMGFAVKDRKMLNHVTVGEQVNFDLLPTGQDQFVVVRITPVSP